MEEIRNVNYLLLYIGIFSNLDQLHEIRGVSMARILCDNTDEIFSVQPLAFHLRSGGL
jgi:hypothetical protein